jgi:hypothetical protein
MLRDIRELAGDPEAYAEELKRRWTGLLSYRYIGRNHGAMNTGLIDNTVKLRHDFRNPAGGLLVSPLSLSAPEGATKSDLEAVPNPVVHCCHILDDARDVKRIEIIQSEALKEGARMNYSRSKIVDADNHDRIIAFTEGQGVSIGRPPEGLQKTPENKIEIVDSPDLPPLWKVFGASKRGDGKWVLPELSLEMASPDAALHLGPQHIVLETAANDLAAELVGTDRLQMQTWHVMFMARGKRGPFRVEGQAVRGTGGQVGVRLLLIDEGDDERSVTCASAMLRVVD